MTVPSGRADEGYIAPGRPAAAAKYRASNAREDLAPRSPVNRPVSGAVSTDGCNSLGERL